MNWYSLFYWISVADNVKYFFDVLSDVATSALIVISIIILICTTGKGIAVGALYGNQKEEENTDVRAWELVRKTAVKYSRIFMVFALLGWIGYSFVPTKKDALLIIAGGTVGNFITKDTSTKALPSEFIQLVREKIKAEVAELRTPSINEAADTLKNKTREELINLLKEKSK